MANYLSNEVVDILLTLDKYNRNYKRASCQYAELYPNRCHPNIRQVIIERRARRNTLHRQK